jgi:hypothetical protein
MDETISEEMYFEQTKLSADAGADIGEAGGDTHSFAAQLLRTMQQLCARISVPVFSHHGILL